MFKKRKKYLKREGLRFAMTLTFISGYVNAFSFVMLDRQFAGIQTGNLLSFGMYLASGDGRQALRFLIPILVFMLGQALTYGIQRKARQAHWDWQFTTSCILSGLMLLTVCFWPQLHPFAQSALLALFASVQVESFKSVRGTIFASVMMTGNIKNAAYFLTKGLVERNAQLLGMAFHNFTILFSFTLGVLSASVVTRFWHQGALALILIPLFALSAWLYLETRLIHQKTQYFR